MRKIVSKVDRELQKFGKTDMNLLTNFWEVVKNKEFIIKEATRVVEDKVSGKKTFFAPAVCHMILCNPQDVDKEMYDKLVRSIVYTPDLNRITVFDNMSFLYLVLRNNELELDDYELERVGSELNKRISEKNINKVHYFETNVAGEAVAILDEADFTISVTEQEAIQYEQDGNFYINEESNRGEIELLHQLEMLGNTCDVDVENMIKGLYANNHSLEFAKTIPMVRSRVLSGQK